MSRWAGAIVLVLAAVGTAVLLGFAAGTLSTAGAIAIGVLGFGAVAVILFRLGMRSAIAPPAADVAIEPEDVIGRAETTGLSDRVLRLPRILFYLGALTLTFSSARPALGLTLSALLFTAAFCITAVAVLAGRPAGRVPNALILGVALFAFGGLISSVGADAPPGSANEVLQGVYVMLLWVWTGATVLRTRPQLLAAITLWTLSTAIDGLSAITQTLGSDILTGPLLGSRATGLNLHANDLGGACAVALVPALMFATSRFPGSRFAQRGLLLRAPRWAIVGLIAAGLVLSGSVTAMLAAFVALVVWTMAPAVRAPGRLAVITALAFTMLAVMLAGGRVSSPVERVEQVTSSSGTQQSSGSSTVRMRTVERAFSRIADDPIVGVGFDGSGGVVTVIDKGRSTPHQVHSAPVAAWYQGGIFGLIGLLIVAMTLARTGWRSFSTGDQGHLIIGLAIFAGLIAFAIIAATSPFVFQQYGWFAGVILIAWSARRVPVAELLVAPGEERRVMPALRARPLAH